MEPSTTAASVKILDRGAAQMDPWHVKAALKPLFFD